MKLIPPTSTAMGPAQNFTGDVYVNTLHTGDAPSRLLMAMVLMCHLAVVEREDGAGALWLEPVTDEEYYAASEHARSTLAGGR